MAKLTTLERLAKILDGQNKAVTTTACPKCRALPGEKCRALGSDPRLNVRLGTPHKARVERAKPKIATRGACADKGEPHDFDPTSGICRKCHTYA